MSINIYYNDFIAYTYSALLRFIIIMKVLLKSSITVFCNYL